MNIHSIFNIPIGPEIVILVIGGTMLVTWWVYRDARQRGIPYYPLVSLVIGILFLAAVIPGLVGLSVYIYLRPERFTT